MSIENMLVNRGKAYGNFYENASTIQHLKEVVFEHAKDWNKMQPDVRQALEMICTKIGRILSGDAGHVDTWEDIAGYAVLVADRIKGDQAWAGTAKTVEATKNHLSPKGKMGLAQMG